MYGEAGSLNDTVNRGYMPRVEVYRDKPFGGLMFLDPTAPCAPMPRCGIVAPNNGVNANAPARAAP